MNHKPVLGVFVKPTSFHEGNHEGIGIARPVGEERDFLIGKFPDVAAGCILGCPQPQQFQRPNSAAEGLAELPLKSLKFHKFRGADLHSA
jgi:hypothetical protein